MVHFNIHTGMVDRYLLLEKGKQVTNSLVYPSVSPFPSVNLYYNTNNESTNLHIFSYIPQ